MAINTNGHLIKDLCATAINKFTNQIEVSGDCWIWTGQRKTTPRGTTAPLVHHLGKELSARTVAWFLLTGEIPDARPQVSCNNELCVKPEHICANTETFFWAKVGETNEKGCWLWKGQLCPKNYAKFSWHHDEKLDHSASRYSYWYHNGSLPKDGEVVRHKCDNPPCVNPEHLISGTYKDNYWDARIQGRHTHGEISGNAKLTEEQVRTLKHSYSGASVETLKSLAAQWGVGYSCLWLILDGRNWKHVQ